MTWLDIEKDLLKEVKRQLDFMATISPIAQTSEFINDLERLILSAAIAHDKAKN